MKWPLMLGVVLVLLTWTSIANAEEAREAKKRFKGVELYSWKTDAGDWLFVLVDGTNRLKTEAEIKGTKNPIKGADNLKKAIALLAVGEHVSWAHHAKGFEYPTAATRKEIVQSAKDAKIELFVDVKD